MQLVILFIIFLLGMHFIVFFCVNKEICDCEKFNANQLTSNIKITQNTINQYTHIAHIKKHNNNTHKGITKTRPMLVNNQWKRPGGQNSKPDAWNTTKTQTVRCETAWDWWPRRTINKTWTNTPIVNKKIKMKNKKAAVWGPARPRRQRTRQRINK